MLEKALEPWPGISCKAIVVAAHAQPDSAARDWLAGLAPDASPRLSRRCRSSASPAGAENAPMFYDDTLLPPVAEDR